MIKTCDACGEPETHLRKHAPESYFNVCPRCYKELDDNLESLFQQLFDQGPADLSIAGMRIQKINDDALILSEIDNKEFEAVQQHAALTSKTTFMSINWTTPCILQWFIAFSVKDDPEGRYQLFRFTFPRPTQHLVDAINVHLDIVNEIGKVLVKGLRLNLETIASSLPESLNQLSK